jgi:hypothetical protein
LDPPALWLDPPALRLDPPAHPEKPPTQTHTENETRDNRRRKRRFNYLNKNL